MTAAPLLEATDLTVRFGNVTALAGLDLVAPTGEVLALLGPNGAGKTTFVRTIATLLAPTSGRLRVRGIDVVRDPLAVRRTIGLAGQHAAVEPTLTGRENLVMTARFFGHDRKAAERAAAIVIDQLSLDEVADRRCKTYRVASAAGSISEPAWSAHRGCCCSTNRPRRSTRSAATRCGTRSGTSSPPAPTCCSRRITWTRPTSWPTTSWSSTTAMPSRRAPSASSRQASAKT